MLLADELEVTVGVDINWLKDEYKHDDEAVIGKAFITRAVKLAMLVVKLFLTNVSKLQSCLHTIEVKILLELKKFFRIFLTENLKPRKQAKHLSKVTKLLSEDERNEELKNW